jgi:hypothetical protein
MRSGGPDAAPASLTSLAQNEHRPRRADSTARKGNTSMLMTLFVILLVAWFLGLVSSYTLGGFIHLLLVIAIAVVLIRIIQGRRPV